MLLQVLRHIKLVLLKVLRQIKLVLLQVLRQIKLVLLQVLRQINLSLRGSANQRRAVKRPDKTIHCSVQQQRKHSSKISNVVLKILAPNKHKKQHSSRTFTQPGNRMETGVFKEFDMTN